MLLTRDNVVKLADLGLAKYLSKSSVGRTFTGSPAYMSPEQYRGRKSDLDDLEEFETHNFNTDVW
jgi:serine/threonine protein kinase